MTTQTAVLIETLVALGAEVRWASCNIFSTQDQAAAAVVVGDGTPDAPAGVPVFAWKGETLEEYWEQTLEILRWPDGKLANMILDDGGDATLLVHRAVEALKTGEVPQATDEDPEELHVIVALIKRSLEEGVDWLAIGNAIQGVTEETTTGVHRLYEMFRERPAAVPGHQRQRLGHQVKFDNKYGTRHSLSTASTAPPTCSSAARPSSSAATATSARAAPRRCAARARASSSPRSTPSARCRPRWTASRSPRSRTCCRRSTSSSPPPAAWASSPPTR